MALAAFSFWHLTTAGSDYQVLTTSDSGFFFDLARGINETDGIPEVQEHSHPPGGKQVSGKGQFQPLMLVTMYRGLHTLDPSLTLMEVSQYFGPFIFILSLIGMFLAGRELGGDITGGASAFLLAVLVRPIYWTKMGAFDREITLIFFGTWIFYFLVKLFRSPSKDILKYSIITGLVTGIFFITWPGALYIATIPIGALILVLLVKLPSHYKSASTIERAIIENLRENLYLIGGVTGVLLISTIMAIELGGYPPDFWMSFAERITGFFGLGGGGGGLSSPRVATEMQKPTNYLASLNSTGTFNDMLLTKISIGFVAIGILRIFWTRKNHEFLIIPWLIVPAAMGISQARFFRLFWPVWPVLVAFGVGSLIWFGRQLLESPTFLSSEWGDRFRNPLVLALVVLVLTVPFIHNARAQVSDRGPRPHGGTDPTTYHSMVESFKWVNQNTSENAIFAIEWSYGSLLTGLADRTSVTDGATTSGIWENRELPPPDYAKKDVNGDGKITSEDDTNGDGKWDVEAGRRDDIQKLYYQGADQFEDTIQTYRDDYNLKIDYWVANFGHTYKNQMCTSALLNIGGRDFQNYQSRSFTESGQRIFNFGKENVVYTGENAYVLENGDKKYLAGIITLLVKPDITQYLKQILQGYPAWRFRFIAWWNNYYLSLGRTPSHTFIQDPDLEKVLWVYGNLTQAGKVSFVHAQISQFDGTPVIMRVQDDFNIPSFLEKVYSAPSGQAEVYKIRHKPDLLTPENAESLDNDTPTFEWSDSIGATKWEIAVDDDQDFSSLEISENVKVSRYTPSQPLPGGEYHWRVRAFNKENITTGWTQAHTFELETTSS